MDTSVVAVDDRSNEVKPKLHFTGKVLKTTLAGAILDVGLEKPGVLHISQIVGTDPSEPIKRVEDVLQVGQSVEVWVRRVKDDRIELTMIQPLGLDWRDIKVGMTVKGTVTRLEKFGAFVEIGAERPGLIHISEMAHGYVRTPADLVKEGDEVESQVLEVNRRKKQIKLSMKALVEPPAREEEPARMIETAQKDRSARRRRPRSDSRDSGGDYNAILAEEQAQSEPDPTAMEMALREAMEKAKSRKGQSDKGKRSKNVSQEQESILSRTLENKVKTN